MSDTTEPSDETNETRPPEDNMGTDNEPNENPEDQLHQDLNQLRALSNELNSTKEPSRVSLASSLQNIIESINIAHSEITNLSQYRARMREHYSTGLSKEQIKDLNITKAQLYSKFIVPSTGQPPAMMRARVCMDWCIYQPWRDNWRKRWFMVFDRPSCNNLEVPQYFLRKLWAEFELGYHVNYFDITEFQGVSLGSAQD
jgi:hypothetical protein